MHVTFTISPSRQLTLQSDSADRKPEVPVKKAANVIKTPDKATVMAMDHRRPRFSMMTGMTSAGNSQQAAIVNAYVEVGPQIGGIPDVTIEEKACQHAAMQIKVIIHPHRKV